MSLLIEHHDRFVMPYILDCSYSSSIAVSIVDSFVKRSCTSLLSSLFLVHSSFSLVTSLEVSLHSVRWLCHLMYQVVAVGRIYSYSSFENLLAEITGLA